MKQSMIVAAGAALGLAVLLSPKPAAALTMAECSTKYQAAKTANTLKGKSWNDFRKAECADDDVDEAAAASTVKETAPATPATAARPGRATYPKAVSTKYKDETPGKARLQTCADQYNANKARSETANGGMLWIQKGGGYWSECNKRLKAV